MLVHRPHPQAGVSMAPLFSFYWRHRPVNGSYVRYATTPSGRHVAERDDTTYAAQNEVPVKVQISCNLEPCRSNNNNRPPARLYKEAIP